MDYKFNTKFKKEKIEAIFKKVGLLFSSDTTKDTYLTYVNYYGQKRKIIVSMRKTLINVARYNEHCNGITSYKQLEIILIKFCNNIKNEILKEKNL